MGKERHCDPAAAMAHIPGGLFVLTSTCEGRNGAVVARWVQPCSDRPPMVMVALGKGQVVEPLIRGSRSFALCQVSETDRFLLRKFGDPHERDDDALISMTVSNAPSGCPIIDRAMSYLDCEVVRHVELDSDHRIYVGLAHSGAVLNAGAPAVFFGLNGASHANGETCGKPGEHNGAADKSR